ncbi:hypothetical protein GF378_01790 [Candidatus Pacearchaeota archaeon]|nr:hypothetical protein [Candidatus Pacearchaeota archaeon]
MEKPLTFYWFVIIFGVALILSMTVIKFHDHPYDIRDVEGLLLKNKIADCIAPSGRLNSKVLNKTKTGFNQTFFDNFLKECNLNLSADDRESYNWDEEIQYYFEVVFRDMNEKEIYKFEKGNAGIKGLCLDNEKKFALLPGCFKSFFYTISKDKENRYFIDILTSVRKTEKNAKLK